MERDAGPATLRDRAVQTAIAVREKGGDALIAQHEQAWADLWQADVIIEGDAPLARQARVDLFNLTQCAGADDRWAWPVGGMASTVYNGGVFWDCDLFQLPAMLPLHPHLCRGPVSYRQRIADTAIARAEAEGLAGLKYAWESDLRTGLENHAPNDHDMPRREVHVNATVALAQWWFFCATGDHRWLAERALPVLAGVADLFVSMVRPIDGTGEQFGLLDIWCVNEREGLVDRCAYTTAAARKVLQLTDYAARLCGRASNPGWLATVRRLAMPTLNGRIVGHANTDQPLSWGQALLTYPLEWPFESNEVQSNLAEPQGWDMSFQAIQAAVAGDAAAMRRYLDHQADAFPMAPFGVRAEAPGRDAIPFHTGCGAFLQAWLYGVTGLRWRESGLNAVYRPCLPQGIQSVEFPNLTWHQRRHHVVVDRHGLSMTSNL